MGWAWGTLVVGLILGIALVDFLAQNTHSVRIEFFWTSGQVPIVVALLVAALAGAAIVLIVGGARIGQFVTVSDTPTPHPLRRRLHPATRHNHRPTKPLAAENPRVPLRVSQPSRSRPTHIRWLRSHDYPR